MALAFVRQTHSRPPMGHVLCVYSHRCWPSSGLNLGLFQNTPSAISYHDSKVRKPYVSMSYEWTVAAQVSEHIAGMFNQYALCTCHAWPISLQFGFSVSCFQCKMCHKGLLNGWPIIIPVSYLDKPYIYPYFTPWNSKILSHKFMI